ncbi:hypothetical protein A6M21_09660 [Desulfotomaculum copahuensis]|uniref:Uncharacterized protein n=1 Tax=Desulfotomaculum copahuensis TaxID=1838280 RepID=A0A1B7LEF6_9FIRM|nr:hypothetical protein A6M21_09660 [Desulfotomaculum copahuensis]
MQTMAEMPGKSGFHEPETKRSTRRILLDGRTAVLIRLYKKQRLGEVIQMWFWSGWGMKP